MIGQRRDDEETVARRTDHALAQLEAVLARTAAVARDLLATTSQSKEPDHG